MDSTSYVWSVIAATLLIVLVIWIGVPSHLYTYYRHLRIGKRLNLTGMPTHWFWGHTPYIVARSPEEWFQLLTTRAKAVSPTKIYSLWVGPIFLYVGILHPDPIRKILKEPKEMSVYRMFKPWIGDGLFVSEGKKWFHNRRLLTPAFHYEILKPYIQVTNSCLEIMLNQWQESARKNEPVKVFDSVSFLTLDILLRCAFSYTSDCQVTRTSAPFVNAIYSLLRLVVERYLNPLHHIDLVYWFTSNGQEMRR